MTRLELGGSLANNLEAAVRLARRLAGQPVYADTLRFWRDFVARTEATRGRLSLAATAAIEPSVAQVPAGIARRVGG